MLNCGTCGDTRACLLLLQQANDRAAPLIDRSKLYRGGNSVQKISDFHPWDQTGLAPQYIHELRQILDPGMPKKLTHSRFACAPIADRPWRPFLLVKRRPKFERKEEPTIGVKPWLSAKGRPETLQFDRDADESHEGKCK